MKIKHFVIFAIASILIFTVAEFIAGCVGVSHDTLTTCFFACFGGELLCTCALKLFENKEDKEDDNGNVD